MASSEAFSKEIYNISGSGWKSSKWNWGYNVGTGHDCALICRRKYSDVNVRANLLNSLWNPVEDVNGNRDPNFEEVKLILGLAWQKGRWDGSDGGAGGYSEVLQMMTDAKRYETDNENSNAKIFSEDILSRLHLISTEEVEKKIITLKEECDNDYDLLRRKSSSLVLFSMGFIQKGL